MSKIYWTKECDPTKWDVGESYWFPYASWFAKKTWGMALINAYVNFRRWWRVMR